MHDTGKQTSVNRGRSLRGGIRSLAVLIGGALIALSGASAAQATCAPTPASPVFASFADTANYSLAPGGDFETGAAGWALSGAQVVAGNEPFHVGSAQDTHALAVSPAGLAVSAPFCAGADTPSFRFFAHSLSGRPAPMLVKLRWTQGAGQVGETTVASLNAYSQWAATPSLPLYSLLPLRGHCQSLSVQLVLAPANGGSAWQIDDVYIDPGRRS